MQKVLAVLITISVLACAAQEPEHKVRVSWGVAKSKAVEHPKLECPAIANAVKLRGVVEIEIQIDRDGKVRSTKVKSGHPMLVQAALDNIRGWKFEPMLLNGEKLVMETTAELEPCGTPDKAYEKEQKVRDEQMAAEHDCREKIGANEFDKAEPLCKRSLELADKVAGNTYLYQEIALQDMGRLRLAQGNAKDALPLFERALKLLAENQKPEEAEQGYAVAWIGIAKQNLGDNAGALSAYERSERIFEARVKATEWKEMRERYEKQLASVRNLHAKLLDKLGRSAEAEELRKRSGE